MAEKALAGLRSLLIGDGRLVQATASMFRADGAVVATASDRGDAAAAVANAAARLGALDVCAWFATPRAIGPLLATDDPAWGEDAARVLLGAHRVAMAAARVMASGGGGAIVLVGSMDATHAYHGRSSAAAAMSGLLGLVRALGVELASVGVRANAVLVGPMSRDDVAGSAAPLAIGDPERIERTLLRSPIHRFVTPAEVAAAIGFVAGRGSAFMTGQTLRVDGGWASLNQAPDGMKFR